MMISQRTYSYPSAYGKEPCCIAVVVRLSVRFGPTQKPVAL